MLIHGVPEHIRSDNGPEFTAKAIRQWLSANQVKTCLHQARRALGERLCRIVHLQGEGRALRPRDLLHPRGGQGDAGALPDRLQQRASALGARLPGAPGSDRGGGVMESTAKLQSGCCWPASATARRPSSWVLRAAAKSASPPALLQESWRRPPTRQCLKPPGTKTGDAWIAVEQLGGYCHS